ERVLDESRFDAARGQLPQFLEPQPIGLRARAGVQPEALHELLGNAAARAFGDDRRARPDLRTRRVVRARPTIFLHAHIAETYSSDRLIGVEEGLRRGKARKN